MDWTALSVSARLALSTVLILIPVSVLVGRWLAWGDVRGRRLIEAVVMLPLVLPPTVLGYYLLVGLAPGSLAGRVVSSLIGETIVFSFPGILVASLIANLPFAIQPVVRALEGIPASLREAAWVSGLSPWQTFRSIELPLAWPGIATAFALTFAHTLGEFGVVLMMGGNIPGETQTLSIAIYDRMQSSRTEEAGVMAGVLLAVSFAAILAVQMSGSRRRGAYG